MPCTAEQWQAHPVRRASCQEEKRVVRSAPPCLFPTLRDHHHPQAIKDFMPPLGISLRGGLPT